MEKLKLLGILTEQGHSIGNLARLSGSELQRLASVIPREPRSRHGNAELIEALKSLDFEALDRLILKARIGVPLRAFVIDIASPLLFEIGRLVEKGALDIAQEHAFSAILRTHLGELLAQVQRASDWFSEPQSHLPKLLFSTPEGDLHEFGILLAAILSGSHGFKFRYLGPNMPAESLAKAAAFIGVDIVVLGSVQAGLRKLAQPLKEYVRSVSRELAKNSRAGTEVWIGGHCDFELNQLNMSSPLFHTATFVDFELRLEHLKSRSQKPMVPA